MSLSGEVFVGRGCKEVLSDTRKEWSRRGEERT